jgi:hypothetical protein
MWCFLRRCRGNETETVPDERRTKQEEEKGAGGLTQEMSTEQGREKEKKKKEKEKEKEQEE